MKEIVIPIVVSVVVGISASYMSIQNSVVRFEQEILVLSRDLTSLNAVVEVVRDNQIQLAARGEWMKRTDLALEILREEMSIMRNSRYTDKDAKKDLEILRKEILEIKNELEYLTGKKR